MLGNMHYIAGIILVFIYCSLLIIEHKWPLRKRRRPLLSCRTASVAREEGAARIPGLPLPPIYSPNSPLTATPPQFSSK